MWSPCEPLTFLWLLSTEGVTKAFSHRSHLYFLWPSCTTWMWTLSVSFLLKVASHWSHLKVLSPVAGGGHRGSFGTSCFLLAVSTNTVITHSKRRPNFTRAIVRAENYIEGFYCSRQLHTMVLFLFFEKTWPILIVIVLKSQTAPLRHNLSCSKSKTQC